MIYERETIYGWGYLHVRGGRLSMGVGVRSTTGETIYGWRDIYKGDTIYGWGISTRGTHLRAGDYLHVRGGRLSTGVGGMICEGGDYLRAGGYLQGGHYLRAGGYLHVRGGRLSMGGGISTCTRGKTIYGKGDIYKGDTI